MENFIHEIKLPGNDDFANKFNNVSELFEKWTIEALSPEVDPEKEKIAWELFFEAKFRLESGQ